MCCPGEFFRAGRLAKGGAPMHRGASPCRLEKPKRDEWSGIYCTKFGLSRRKWTKCRVRHFMSRRWTTSHKLSGGPGGRTNCPSSGQSGTPLWAGISAEWRGFAGYPQRPPLAPSQSVRNSDPSSKRSPCRLDSNGTRSIRANRLVLIRSSLPRRSVAPRARFRFS